MRFEKLSDKEEKIASDIVDCAFKVHKALGPGLLERIYEVCFCHELKKKNIDFRTQVNIPINYEGVIFEEGLKLDVLVENLVICELKAVVEMNPVFEAQIHTYLKLCNKRLGFLINFNVPLIKNGIKRIII